MAFGSMPRAKRDRPPSLDLQAQKLAMPHVSYCQVISTSALRRCTTGSMCTNSYHQIPCRLSSLSPQHLCHHAGAAIYFHNEISAAPADVLLRTVAYSPQVAALGSTLGNGECTVWYIHACLSRAAIRCCHRTGNGNRKLISQHSNANLGLVKKPFHQRSIHLL